MPLRDFRCPTCEKVEEHFYWMNIGPPSSCPDCGGPLETIDLSARPRVALRERVFPFTTRNIDPNGHPITIESLGHLRRVERRYGVVASAFSQKSLSDPTPMQTTPVYRGHERD